MCGESRFGLRSSRLSPHQRHFRKDGETTSRAYSYPQLSIKNSAQAPGQFPIGTGGQYSIGADTRCLPRSPMGGLRPSWISPSTLARGGCRRRRCGGGSISGTGRVQPRSCAGGSMVEGKYYPDSLRAERLRCRCYYYDPSHYSVDSHSSSNCDRISAGEAVRSTVANRMWWPWIATVSSTVWPIAGCSNNPLAQSASASPRPT